MVMFCRVDGEELVSTRAESFGTVEGAPSDKQPVTEQTATVTTEDVDADSQRRATNMQEYDDAGVFSAVATASVALQTAVRTQIQEAALAGRDPEVSNPLLSLASNNDTQLAAEATAC